jgi:cytochrome P450
MQRLVPPGPDEPYNVSRELLDWMRDQFARFGDTYRASIYEIPSYVTRNPDYAGHVLRDNWRNYVKGQAVKRVALLLGNGLIVSEGEFWKRQRRMIQPAFHRETIAGLVDIARCANATLLRNWEQAARESAPVNVTLDISRMVLEVILGSIFGDDRAQVGPHFSILSENPARGLEFAQRFRSLGRVIQEVVDQRRRQQRVAPDILGFLMEARDPLSGQGMAQRQLLNEVMTLIVAGHETTALTLNWVWYLLALHPAVDRKLAMELDNAGPEDCSPVENLSRFAYTRQTIEEALRLYPPVWLMTRRALQSDKLGDYFVPAGTEIYIPNYFIQRHPDLWRDPDCFDPDRFGTEQSSGRHRLATLPFSAGPRNCIGETFARMEMQVHLIMVASRLSLRYSEQKPLDLELGVNLRNKNDFTMTPEFRT